MHGEPDDMSNQNRRAHAPTAFVAHTGDTAYLQRNLAERVRNRIGSLCSVR